MHNYSLIPHCHNNEISDHNHYQLLNRLCRKIDKFDDYSFADNKPEFYKCYSAKNL